MNISMFLVFFVFGIVSIWFSADLWIAPSKFINKIHNMRTNFYKSSYGKLSIFGYSEELAKNPKLEIWLARFGFTFVYVVAVFGLIKSFV